MYDQKSDPMVNVAKGLFAIAQAIDRLGTADAATPMGAIELLASAIKESADEVACAQRDVATSIADAIGGISIPPGRPLESG